jgi:glycosyltransferase involved in cell wall biosynthesis
MPPIYVIGYPSSIGGANTELWHTLKLWRVNGLDVTCCHFWGDPPAPEWIERVKGIGCRSVIEPWDTDRRFKPLLHIPRGSTVVAFCNYWFLRDIRAFDLRDCRIVWVPCMTWQFPQEALWTKVCGMLDAYVYQSTYQAAQMAPLIESQCKAGRHPFLPERFHQIRGAFDIAEFPFSPKPVVEGGPFVIGRLSRSSGNPSKIPAVEKYPADLWQQYAAIKRRIPSLRARVMGWNAGIEEKCGPPPEWAETLPDCSESVQDFLGSLHCLVPGIGCCRENWPRVGLEAMAAGVPLVVEAKGGWPEMTPCVAGRKEQTDLVANMAAHSGRTLSAALVGRGIVESQADPTSIWGKWKQLFEGLR